MTPFGNKKGKYVPSTAHRKRDLRLYRKVYSWQSTQKKNERIRLVGSL